MHSKLFTLIPFVEGTAYLVILSILNPCTPGYLVNTMKLNIKAYTGMLIGLWGMTSVQALESDRLAALTQILDDPQTISHKRYSIVGMNLALFDDTQTLWKKSFGKLSKDDPRPITFDTLFSIQSQSKMLTTLAVLAAMDKHPLKLSDPILKTLPDFTVNSAFQASAHRHIQLHHLLTHTAGFTHEAPIGHNYSPRASTYDAHILSIQDTWLKFPVGQRVAYSNLGIDLAGRILEKVTHKPLVHVIQNSVLKPLGMSKTTFDYTQYRRSPNASKGHSQIFNNYQAPIPFPASGGAYSTLEDMIAYGQFFLKYEKQPDQQFISKRSMQWLYNTPFRSAFDKVEIGLTVHKLDLNGVDVFFHDGGGFGYSSCTLWIPKHNIGMVYLSNTYNFEIKEDLLNLLRHVLPHGPARPLEHLPPDTLNPFLPNVISKKDQWPSFVGTYDLLIEEHPMDTLEVTLEHGELLMNHQPLYEYQPGLFFTQKGEALDFRYPIKTYRNIPIYKRFSSHIRTTDHIK